MIVALRPACVFAALSLGDYNTRVVLAGATILGVASAIIGTFLFLRKRSLIGDVVGHSALPGIAIAFLVIETIRPGSGRSIPGLLIGAGLSGLFGAYSVALIRRFSKVQSDAALAVVLSVFYGAGVALLTVVQRLPTGSAAGLKDYLNGKTATLMAQDVQIFAVGAVVILVVTILFFKELTLLCFDEDYAATAGLSVSWLDAVLTLLAAGVTVIGMQTVGLLLITATLVIPPASARFWTDNVRVLAVLAALIGGLSSALGVLISASAPRLAAGPLIVLAGGEIFGISLAFGRRRGVVWTWLMMRRDAVKADRLDLLRAIYEALESQGIARTPATAGPATDVKAVVSASQLEPFRTWPRRRLERTLRRAAGDGLLTLAGPGEFGVTNAAWDEARRVARNHRLWELYLIRYADVAPASVDRNADLIEHVLDRKLVEELESALARETPLVPVSPHVVQHPAPK